MYELKRAKKIDEQVKIGDKEITISLSVENIAKEFNVRYSAVVKAEKEVEKYKNNTDEISQLSDAMEVYGVAITHFLQLIFGEDNTKEILDYYEGNYIEMVYEAIPFIQEVIVPRLEQYVNEERKNLSKKYKGKSARRK